MKYLTISLTVLLILTIVPAAFAQDESPLPTPSPEPIPQPPQPGDDDALEAGLLWLFGGGGAGVAAFWFLGKSKWFGGLNSEYKRYISLVFTAVLGVLAFMAATGLGYVESPTTAQGWLEKLSSIAYATTATALVVHGYKKAREKEA